MSFKNRQEAAGRLAAQLPGLKGRHPLVLGIPRGGVVMADVLARELEGDLDVALVRKLRAPNNPEFAVGAVTEQGKVYMNQGWEEFIPEPYLRTEIQEALSLLRARREAYTPHRPPISPAGRLTLVVDDGIATGATMVAALRSLKGAGAERVIAAAAVAPPQTARALEAEADQVVCLETPEPFYAVSLYFEDFSEVTDLEVTQLLRPGPEGSPSEPGRSVPLYHGNFGWHPPERRP